MNPIPQALMTAALHLTPLAISAGKAAHAFTSQERKKQARKPYFAPSTASRGAGRYTQSLHPNKERELIMRKSTFAAMLVVLAAIAGALGAAYLYLRRREAELDEYEQLLFSEDFNEETAEDADEEEETEPAAEADVNLESV